MPSTYEPWRPASNGASGRRWFVMRQLLIGNRPHSARAQYHESASGNLIRFGSRESALACAERLDSLDPDRRAKAAEEHDPQ